MVRVVPAGIAELVRPPPLTMGHIPRLPLRAVTAPIFSSDCTIERDKWAVRRRAPEARVVTTRTPKADGIDGCLWCQPLALKVLEVVRLPDELRHFRRT